MASLADAERNLVQEQAESAGSIARLRQTLKEELLPPLEAAQKEVARLRPLRDKLIAQQATLAAARQEATEQLGNITKRQLSEIKQLVRSPPDTIRRTLIALWLLLHSKRFEGKANVAFDDNKDWPRCQRMLADQDFISDIFKFDPSVLAITPHVPKFVASHFFGFIANEAGDATDGSSVPVLPDLPPPVVTRERTSGRLSSKFVPQKPLDIQMVAHASEPCGALLQWMLELLHEYFDRQRLKISLAAVDGPLADEESRVAKLENAVAEAEASLATKQRMAEEQDRKLQQLKVEKAAVQKAEGDLKKLEAMEAQQQHAGGSRLHNELPQQKNGNSKSRESGLQESASSRATTKSRRAVSTQLETPTIDLDLKVELEFNCGTMAHKEQELSQLRVNFGRNAVKVLVGDVEQALVLPKIADILKDHKGKLKLLIEGHCEEGEREEVALERSLAVYQWLIEGALCPPGLLRIRGCTPQGMGRCAVPVPIQELMVVSGPMSAEIQALSSAKTQPGLFFPESVATLTTETRSIASKMASWLCDEDQTIVRVEGHTDKDEPDDVALQRAMAVREVFVGMGVKARQVKLISCKHLHPISRIHQALNRRVEVHED